MPRAFVAVSVFVLASPGCTIVGLTPLSCNVDGDCAPGAACVAHECATARAPLGEGEGAEGEGAEGEGEGEGGGEGEGEGAEGEGAEGEGEGEGGGEGEGEGEGAPVVWSLVQFAIETNSVATLGVAPTGSGNLLVVSTMVSDTPTGVSDDAGNVYQHVDGASAVGVGTNLDLWFTPSSNAGAANITVASASPFAVGLWEVSGFGGAVAIDAVAHVDNANSDVTVVGPPVAVTSAGDFAVAHVIFGSLITGSADAVFIEDSNDLGNGWAHLASPSTGAATFQPTWTSDVANPFGAGVAAFKPAQ